MASPLYLCLLLILLLPLFIFYFIYRPPRLLIRYFQYLWPDILWEAVSRIPPGGAGRVIALTIDDAPSEYTHDILRVLRANDAHATLFVIGAQVEGYEEVLKEAVADGNELGNHGMHDEAARSLSLEVLEEQISKVQVLIRKAYTDAGRREGPAHQYYRPGSGLFSTGMRALVSRLGYRLVLGGIYPHDPQVPYSWLNAWHIMSMARNGGIIVCHDRRSWTVPMLKRVLPELKRKGYQVVTVTRLLETATTRLAVHAMNTNTAPDRLPWARRGEPVWKAGRAGGYSEGSIGTISLPLWAFDYVQWRCLVLVLVDDPHNDFSFRTLSVCSWRDGFLAVNRDVPGADDQSFDFQAER